MEWIKASDVVPARKGHPPKQKRNWVSGHLVGASTHKNGKAFTTVYYVSEDIARKFSTENLIRIDVQWTRDCTKGALIASKNGGWSLYRNSKKSPVHRTAMTHYPGIPFFKAFHLLKNVQVHPGIISFDYDTDMVDFKKMWSDNTVSANQQKLHLTA